MLYFQFWLNICAQLAIVAVGARPKLFYIYEFPESFVDVWPKRETRLGNYSNKIKTPVVWKHLFNENEGFGHHYNGTEYFETWQYSAFRLVLSRLLRSKYRTRDISQASLFFLPYDSGAECYVDEYGTFRTYGNPIGDAVLAHIQKLPTYTRNHGYDHFFVHSSSLVAHPASVKFKNLINYCLNATYLTVEKYPIVHGWLRHMPFIQPVPMASMYHWRGDSRRDGIPALRPMKRRNEIFISYFASANTLVPNANKLRRKLFIMCEKANEDLNEKDGYFPDIKRDFGSACKYDSFSGANRDTIDALGIMAAYEKSVYCMCPYGDTPIRRAIFDALLAGCVPVLFRYSSTPYPLNQYDWHLSKEDIENAFVIISAPNDHDKEQIENYIEKLMSSYSEADVRRRQRAVASIARRLQYSMPPDVRPRGLPTVAEPLPTWDPPFDDAVDVILDRMMEKIEKYIPDGGSGVNSAS